MAADNGGLGMRGRRRKASMDPMGRCVYGTSIIGSASWNMWLYLPLLILSATGAMSASTPPTLVFLNESSAPIEVPKNLGDRPHECIGNIRRCLPEGFTVSLSFRPSEGDPSLPADYVLSTGGQSDMSEGFYVRRNYGMEYEVGVALGDQLYTAVFDMDEQLAEQVEINLLFTWKMGLDVYLNGFPLAEDQKALKTRVYTAPAHDPFRSIIVGGAEDQLMASATSRQRTIHNIKFWNTFFEIADIKNLLAESEFKKGCLASEPNTLEGPQQLFLTGTETAESKCRDVCRGRQKLLALVKSTQCLCYTPENLKDFLSQATAADDICWSVYFGSPEVHKDYPINFAFTKVKPTTNAYICPNETLVFNLQSDTMEMVTYHVDFGDGNKLTTSDTSIGYAWKSAGLYSVNITAITRTTKQSLTDSIQIQCFDEGVKPYVVKVQPSVGSNPKEVVVKTVAISPQEMDCALSLGDGEVQKYDGLKGLVHSMEFTHTYSTVGLYNVSMTCTNKNGTTQEKVITQSINKTMDYETNVFGRDIITPFFGGDSHHSLVDVEVNYMDVSATLGGSEVTVPGPAFIGTGEHLLVLKRENQLLRQRVVNLQKEIGRAGIEAKIIHTEKDTPIPLNFTVLGGDHMHVHIEYGDGTEEWLYFTEGSLDLPILMNREHSYKDLGKYTVKISAANDVSYREATQLVSIERPIFDARVSVRDVPFLGQKAEFVFEVDYDSGPATPIRVDFDFGNGETGGGEIGGVQEDNAPATFFYEYPKYGMYDVIVTVSNNLSSQVLVTSLQVGENITYVDLSTKSEVVTLEEDFEIVIDCPKGQPILYEITTGDGTTIKVSVPWNYTTEQDMVRDMIDEDTQNFGGGDVETTTPYVYYTTHDMGVMITGNDSVVQLSRKKRSAQGDPDAPLTTVIVPTQNDANAMPSEMGNMGTVDATTQAPDTMANGSIANPLPPTTATTTTTTTPAPTRPPNEKMIVTHKYKEVGEYTVKVRTLNAFGHAETWSCPPMRALPGMSQLNCEGMKVSTATPTSETEPFEAYRSDTVEMDVKVDLTCSSLSGTPKFDYTWGSMWKTADDSGTWRPELGVCHVGSPEPKLTIPPLTLWYGDYHMKVDVRLLVDPATGRVRREAIDEVHVDIETTTAAEDAVVRDNLARAKEELKARVYAQMMAHSDHVEAPEDFKALQLSGQELTVLKATADFYLKVKKTPLVAELKGDKHLDVPKFDVINLSAEPSHDPDVAVPGNRTGMNAHIFCYPDRLADEWRTKTLQDKLFDSRKLANNTMEDCAIYDYECFQTVDRVWVLGWEAVFLADLLYKNDSMNFELVVTKDERVATDSKSIRVLFSNATGVDMLNNIDALLASGDTNAALLVIGMVSGLLDSPAGASGNVSDEEAKKAKTSVRGKLIGALEKVSGNLQNFDQLSKTTDVLNGVTAVGDEVTEDSKVSAASALGNAGDACAETAANAPVDKVTDTAGGLVGCVGNVLPFPEEQPLPEGFMTTDEPQIVITTTSSTYVPGSGHVTSTTTVVTTPTTRTVTTSSPLGVSVTTTPVAPTHLPSVITTPAVLGNITVSVEGLGNMTLSEEGWSSDVPLPSQIAPTTTTTTSTTTTTTTTTTRAPTTTTTTRRPSTTRRTTTTTTDPEETPEFMSTVPPGLAESTMPTQEPVIPCCERTPEDALCEWVEPSCEYLAEEDRKNDTWTDELCDEIHPDDMEVFVQRFRLYKAMLKRIMYGKRKATTTNALKAVDGVGDTLLKKTGDDTNISISTPKMKVQLGKMEAGANGSAGSFDVPGSALNGSSGKVGSVSMESPNPFTYSDSAKDIKTPVKSLSFKDENGTEISVKDTDAPMDLWMEGQPHLVPPAKKCFVEHDKTSTTMSFHNIYVPSNDSSVHIMIFPDNPGDEFDIYIKYLEFPNETYFDWKGQIPNPEMESWNIDDADDANDLRHTFFPDMGVTALNGSYKIGVKLTRSIVSYKDTDKRNSTYNFRVFISGCRFWNELNDTWDSAGCWVGNLTTIRMTQCQCTHLTSFGGDFVVPPNTIDFSTVFSLEKFLEAMPVFITVSLVLFLYVVVCIWARRADKKDLIKWGAAPLEDNLPTDSYHYQITVTTGVKKHASTTSRVSFILSGDTSDTGVRRLADGKRKEFPSGSIFNFVLSVEQCLGPLTYLRIWHDNTGSGKKRSWFLGQIQINDLQTGEKFFFLCNRWLAVEEDDGMVERILPVAGMNDLTAFKHLFNSSVRKKLTNDHMWVSIMRRPTRSNFTRVQRLSCCVSLLFLTMITNCMFFKADEKAENVSVLKIGPLTFTLHQVFISIVTTAIVFPPSMIMVIIFRKARAKGNGIMQANQQYAKKSQKYKWRTFNPGSSYWNVERTKWQKFKDWTRNKFASSSQSKYEEDADNRPLKKKKKKAMTFPWWTVYIAWFLVLGSILGSGFFTILYSMEWGREKSLEWLTTFLLSFFQSVAVVQPIKVLLLAAFISCVLRKPDLDDEEADFDEANGTQVDNSALMNKSQKDLQALMMQRKMANEALQPPDTAALEAARQLRMNEIQMEAVLKEMIIYFIFLMVLFFISYQARSADSFMFSENIKNTFSRNSPSLETVNSAQKWWDFIDKSIIPNLYSGLWYNGRDLDWRERLQMDDRNTMRVGVARLRQHRIKDDSCPIRKEFQTLIHHCRDHYSWTDDDTKDYLTGWEIPTSDTISRQGIEACYMDDMNDSNMTSLHDQESPWVYRSSVELKNAPYSGALSIYKGGGYTFSFKRTKDHTLRLLEELKYHDWVDVNTRALFLEFTLYNANVNLFGSMIILVEFMATGSAITNAEVKVFRLSSYIGGFGVVVIVFEVTFLVFVLYFLFNVLRLVRKQRLKFFKEFWNLLEFSMLILALISILMYAMKKVFGTVAINTLHESGSADYVNFVTISIWDELFGFILAMVVFCATVKFIKMLKFNKRMGMLGSTIRLATKDLKNFSVVFFGFFFAFAMMAYVLFGKNSSNYGSFMGTFEALFAFALGDFDFEELRSIHPLLGPLFFFLYVLIISIGMMGMFLTIIYDAFAEVKANAEHQSNDYEIVDFIMKKLKGVFGWS